MESTLVQEMAEICERTRPIPNSVTKKLVLEMKHGLGDCKAGRGRLDVVSVQCPETLHVGFKVAGFRSVR